MGHMTDLPHDLPPEPCANCGRIFTPFEYAPELGTVRGRHICCPGCLDELWDREFRELKEGKQRTCFVCGHPIPGRKFRRYCSAECACKAVLARKKEYYRMKKKEG